MLALTLQSCFVAKDYTRPELEETEHLYRTDNLPQDSISLADVSWKDMFKDQYLTQYIEEGLQNNLDIRVAIQQIAIANAYMKQGKAGYLPTLTGTAQATHQELSENSQFGGFFSSVDQYELSGSLSWEADIWGKIRSNKRASTVKRTCNCVTGSRKHCAWACVLCWRHTIFRPFVDIYTRTIKQLTPAS